LIDPIIISGIHSLVLFLFITISRYNRLSYESNTNKKFSRLKGFSSTQRDEQVNFNNHDINSDNTQIFINNNFIQPAQLHDADFPEFYDEEQGEIVGQGEDWE